MNIQHRTSNIQPEAGVEKAVSDPEKYAEDIKRSGVPMLEWLVDEIARVKTRKFHLIDGPLLADKRASVERAELAVPPSYKSFIFQFGNAQLYRMGSQYRVQVYADPIADENEEGEQRLCFGRTEDTVAYFKAVLLIDGQESPVFEWHYETKIERQTANDFKDWLRKTCETARRRYTEKQWREIEEGPPAFSEREREIVNARRKFRWRVVGISASGDVRFEVHNGSDMVLPFLSIGIRGKRRGTRGVLDGGVWLPVRSMRPGETAIIEKNCYKDLVDPADIVAFDRPDPGPEDRDRYWEFRQTE